MVNQVFTYFEEQAGPNAADDEELLKLWKQNWHSKGWIPTVLGISDAMEHPHAPVYQRLTENLPTVNCKAYEQACWRRWLAYERVLIKGPNNYALFTDIDVLNLSLTPDSVFPRASCGVWLHKDMTPCVVADWDLVKRFVDLVLSEMPAKPLLGHRLITGKNHYSDMYLARDSASELGAPIATLCEDYPNTDGQPMIHFGNDAVLYMKQPRLQLVKRLLLPLGQ